MKPQVIVPGTPPKRLRFATPEAICAVLDCQPGDILTYQRVGERHEDHELESTGG